MVCVVGEQLSELYMAVAASLTIEDDDEEGGELTKKAEGVDDATGKQPRADLSSLDLLLSDMKCEA